MLLSEDVEISVYVRRQRVRVVKEEDFKSFVGEPLVGANPAAV